MLTVLVVEHDPLVGELIRLTLQDAGYEVRGFSDGASGVTAASEDLPDAVVLDGMTGQEVLWHFKRMAPTLPVFIYSARCDSTERAALMCEADGWFVKSGDIDSLVQAINRAVHHPE